MEAPEYEVYGLTEEEWNALSEEDKESYRAVGSDENISKMEEEEPNA